MAGLVKTVLFAATSSFIILLFSISSRPVYANSILFQDAFSDNSLDRWSLVSNDCIKFDPNATWSVVNNKLSINIYNSPPCSTFIVPKMPPISIDRNYIVKTDIYVTSTNMDRNIIIKFQDLSNWYGLHLIGNNIYVDKVVNGREYFLSNKHFSYFFSPNTTYHIEAEVFNDQYKIYIDDLLIGTALENGTPVFSNYTVGLAASVGANSSSEVSFDNIEIEEINNNIYIDIPDFKQGGTGVSWSNLIYNNYPPTATSQTIKKWGCALTSAAMVLNYWGNDVNPETLNTWLKNHTDVNGNKDGFDISHGVKFATIATYPFVNGNTPHLEFERHPFSFAAIDDELKHLRPVIVKLSGESLLYGSHFVVVKGKEDDEYLINDPVGNSYTKLSDYESSLYSDLRLFKDVSTDLSYFQVYTSQNINALIFDEEKQRLDDKYTYIEEPLVSEDKNEVAGNPLKLFSLPKPPRQNYKVILTGKGIYKSEVNLYSPDGETASKIIYGIAGNNNQDQVQVKYKTEFSIDYSLNLSDVIKDWKTLNELKLIKNKLVYSKVLLNFELANKFYLAGGKFLYKAELKAALNTVKQNTPKYIDLEGGNIMMNSIQSLL